MQLVKELQQEIDNVKSVTEQIEKLIDWKAANISRNYILIEAIKFLDKELIYLEKAKNKLISKNN